MKSLLSGILTARQCAACRFCCSFAKFESWETPLFTEQSIQLLSEKYGSFPVKKTGSVYTLDLDPFYKMHTPEEYAPCPFLNSTSGCMLADEEKPFDCKIWPLRIMRKGSVTVIALTPTCKEINKYPVDAVKKFAEQSGTGALIYKEAEKMPDMIKPYREGFLVLMEHTV